MRTGFFFAVAMLLASPPVFAQAYSGECGTCVNRKARMCADECELVPAEKSVFCQQNCIAEYCSHKCEKNAPEIEAYLKENCNDCEEQQFTLCEVHCKEGTPRKRAVCQIECSEKRCEKACAEPEPPAEKKQESPAPAAKDHS